MATKLSSSWRTQLSLYISGLTYTDGTPVSQVDLVGHSMGGLIVRAYLAGLQPGDSIFAPPSNLRVRKAVFIATPHFGSFQAGVIGTQESELAPGSQFIWDLATWNQFGDDLRGTDAIAIVGNAGSYPASSGNSTGESDGVVSLTSASLSFAEPDQRTRIVPYCHSAPGLNVFGIGMTCFAPYTGIANIDSPIHQTWEIVQSFLAGNQDWTTKGHPPSQDAYLSKYSGIVVADINSANQFVGGLSGVKWSGVSLTNGLANGAVSGVLSYSDFVSGTGTFTFPSSTCGPYTLTPAVYAAVRCKFAPVVYSVGPLLPGTGRIVQAGTTITISGAGFGAQQCSGCQVIAAPPGSTTGYSLKASSWSNGSISASFLPVTMPNLTIPGLVTIYVELSSSAWDSINIMAAAAPTSTIAVAPSSLQFAYTVGGAVPVSQSIMITNSTGGTLNWSATTSASWLSITSASATTPSTPSVLVSPNGLSTGTYTGTVQISSAGASNSPVSVAVTLTVIAAAAPGLAVSPTSLQFAYSAGGALPPARGIQITNNGGGTLNWTAATNAPWLSVSSTSGTAPSIVSVAVSPTNLTAGTYTGNVQISAAGASNSPVLVAVTLTVAAGSGVLSVSPQALTFNCTVGSAVPAAQQISVTTTGGGTLSWTASTAVAWLGLSSAFGTAPAMLGISVNPAAMATGTYTGTISIRSVGTTGTVVSVPVTLILQGAQPTVNITAVSNGATFQPGFASATWVSILGTNLSQTTRMWQNSDFVNGQLPTSLSGVSVTINGQAAYVEYISPTQVNVLAPDDATVGAVQVQVTTTQGKSNNFTAQKEQFAPGFFMLSGSYVNALHADYTLVGKTGLIAGAVSTPAKPGETILLFGTGFGPTSPSLPSAQLVTSSAVLANSVQFTIGGQPASVAYAGLVGAGLYQFNVTVPNMANGDAAIVVQIGAAQTQTGVSITIQQ